MKKVKIGFVGVGAISGIYLENITSLFREIEITSRFEKMPRMVNGLLPGILD